MNVDFLPTKTGEKSPENSQVKIERNKDLRYESALSPFLMRKKGWEEGRKVQETERGENVQKENCRFFRDFRSILDETKKKTDRFS